MDEVHADAALRMIALQRAWAEEDTSGMLALLADLGPSEVEKMIDAVLRAEAVYVERLSRHVVYDIDEGRETWQRILIRQQQRLIRHYRDAQTSEHNGQPEEGRDEA